MFGCELIFHGFSLIKQAEHRIVFPFSPLRKSEPCEAHKEQASRHARNNFVQMKNGSEETKQERLIIPLALNKFVAACAGSRRWHAVPEARRAADVLPWRNADGRRDVSEATRDPEMRQGAFDVERMVIKAEMTSSAAIFDV